MHALGGCCQGVAAPLKIRLGLLAISIWTVRRPATSAIEQVRCRSLPKMQGANPLHRLSKLKRAHALAHNI